MTNKALSFLLRPLLLVAGVLGIAALFFAAKLQPEPKVTDWKATVENWPEKPKEMVQKMADKYGDPNEVTRSMVIWNNNGPWKRTIIYREEVPHSFPMEHTDFVEQFIDYKAPVNMYDEIAQYDGSVIVERTKGEISARCDMEEPNFLAINLAHEVATGKRKVQEARQFYSQTMMAMKQENKMSPYLQKFMFDVAKGNTADPDQPLMMKGSTGGEMEKMDKDKKDKMEKDKMEKPKMEKKY